MATPSYTSSRGAQALPIPQDNARFKKKYGKGRKNASDPLGLFPSTAVTQSEIAKLLAGARTQVKANYAGTELPAQQTYLQPFLDRRASNLALATKAADYMTAASSNAQNLSGAFTSAVAQRIAANQDATYQGGGSLPGTGALPTPAVETIPMNMVGSSWTNLLNAYVPAETDRAAEANKQVDFDSNKALADYRAAQSKRTSDIQAATQTLYQSNLDTLRTQKSDAWKNALTLYSIIGKQKYLALNAAERKREFGITSGQRDRSLDQGDQKITNTEAYRSSSLAIQRKKAKADTGIDTTGALSILNGGKAAAAKGIKTGPVGQLGRTYYVQDLLQSAADSPNGVAIFNTKNPTKVNIDYGKPVPTGKDKTGNVTARVVPGAYYYPQKQPGQQYGPTMASWQQAVQNLRSRYGKKITAAWLATYFPPQPLQ